VIVPAYNAQATVVAAVRSALAQTIDDLEVIVVDDGSTDATAAVVRELDDPRLRVISQANKGLSGARNAGVAVARAGHLAFLDSDDLWLPDYLELTLAALAADPKAGFAYTDAFVFDSSTGRVRRRTAMQRNRPPIPPPDEPAAFLFELLKRNFVFVSITVRRAVLESVGGYSEARAAAEDYDLLLRIVMAGHRAAWVPGQHALYRTHPGQWSANAMRTNEHLAAIYAGLSMDDMPSPAHRDLLTARRREIERTLQIGSGRAPLRAARLRARHLLGRVRKRMGSDPWYDTPPPEISGPFPDLTSTR
jgi:glycosyltransferase involved in cell wall biosynthesis